MRRFSRRRDGAPEGQAAVLVSGPETRRDEVGKIPDHVLGTYREAK
ncbi:hypothetical protein [Streptomyces sp. NPDC127114]